LNSYLCFVGDSLNESSSFCRLLLFLAFPSPAQSPWSCVYIRRLFSIMWRLHDNYYFNMCPKQGIMDRPSIIPYNHQTNLIFVFHVWSLLSNCTNWYTAFMSLSCQKCYPLMSFFTTPRSEKTCEEQGLVNEPNIYTSCCLWHLGMHMAFCILWALMNWNGAQRVCQ
jgi:hypothetical protein